MTMETEIYWLVKNSIKRELRSKIKGNIIVTILCDTVYVDIDANRNTVFRFTEYNILDKIASGMTGETIAFNCYRQYRKYILSAFFK